MYVDVCKLFNIESVKQYVPPAWLALATVKRDHYKAMAHFFTAVGILAMRGTYFSQLTVYFNKFA